MKKKRRTRRLTPPYDLRRVRSWAREQAAAMRAKADVWREVARILESHNHAIKAMAHASSWAAVEMSKIHALNTPNPIEVMTTVDEHQVGTAKVTDRDRVRRAGLTGRAVALLDVMQWEATTIPILRAHYEHGIRS